MSPEPRRDRDIAGINSILNYSYTIIRSLISRSICASGLSASLGVFHHNSLNAFCLSDDIIEPYRAIIDNEVKKLVIDGHCELTNDVKQKLINILDLKVVIGNDILPIKHAVEKTILSFRSFCLNNKVKLLLPEFTYS